MNASLRTYKYCYSNLSAIYAKVYCHHRREILLATQFVDCYPTERVYYFLPRYFVSKSNYLELFLQFSAFAAFGSKSRDRKMF